MDGSRWDHDGFDEIYQGNYSHKAKYQNRSYLYLDNPNLPTKENKIMIAVRRSSNPINMAKIRIISLFNTTMDLKSKTDNPSTLIIETTGIIMILDIKIIKCIRIKFLRILLKKSKIKSYICKTCRMIKILKMNLSHIINKIKIKIIILII